MKCFNFGKTAVFNGKLPSKRSSSVTRGFFGVSLQQQCHPLAAAVLALHGSFAQLPPALILSGEKKGSGLLLQAPLTKTPQLRSWLFSSRAYWTAGVCSPASGSNDSAAEDVVANFHHNSYSRGPLPCLHLRNRTWKVVGISDNKIIRVFYLNLCWSLSAQTHNVWNSERTTTWHQRKGASCQYPPLTVGETDHPEDAYQKSEKWFYPF